MRAKEYIHAAYELIRSGADIQTVLTNLELSLGRRGLTSLHVRILRGLVEKIRRSEHTLVPKVIVARERDLSREKVAIERSCALLGSEIPRVVIDPTIIGGFIAVGNGKRVDQSHKSTLLHVYHKLVD